MKTYAIDIVEEFGQKLKKLDHLMGKWCFERYLKFKTTTLFNNLSFVYWGKKVHFGI